jgi:hypothetical protein
MVHEHQNPEGGIDWDVDAVLNYFSGAPNYWDHGQIYFNVIDKYDSNLLNASQYDPKSIMLYAFPASLTRNGVGTTANAVMSPTDIKWMGKVYGSTKPKKKKKKKKRKIRRTDKQSKVSVKIGDAIVTLEPNGVFINGIIVLPDENGDYVAPDGTILALTEDDDVTIVFEEGEGSVIEGVEKDTGNRAVILGVVVSIVVVAIVMGIVFGVVIPRKRGK